MGKASRWFRGLFGLKKPSSSSDVSSSRPSKEKRRWSFVKSYREKDCHVTTQHNHQNDTPNFVVDDTTTRSAHNNVNVNDQDKHAIAVAAATAAVAEAAVAAAQAAAAVVRLTSGGGSTRGVKNTAAHVSEEWAAVKIQSAFRGCLARKALRALKGLVKLQALVRGHIERKRTAEWLHRMQTLMQAQSRAIVGRSIQASEFHPLSSKSSHYHNHPGPATPEKFEHVIRTRGRKHEQSSLLRKNSSKSNGRAISDEKSGDLRSSSVRNSVTTDDEISDRVLEIDSGKPHVTIKRRSLFHSYDQNSHSFTTSKDSTSHLTVPSPSSYEVVQSLTPVQLQNNNIDVEEDSFCTANNSPQFYSAASSRGGASSRRTPFTPTKSDGSRSFLSGYSDYPNYMSYTESSKAKVRSLSAPKQRPQYERSSSAKRYSIHHGFGEPKQSSGTQRISALHENFMNKAYPGSGRLDKLGMPIGYRY